MTSITRAAPRHSHHRPTGSASFHKTILKEFYQVAFRKKIYTTLESIQEDPGEDVLGTDTDSDVRGRQTNLSREDDLVT
jgi:hypothetical protein